MQPSEFLNEAELAKRGLAGFVCPWCGEARVARFQNPKGSPRWIHAALLVKGPKYRCLPCWLIAGSVCESLRYGSHPDLNFLQHVAEVEGWTMLECRSSLLRQALSDVMAAGHYSQREKEQKLTEIRDALARCRNSSAN
jgi:hypothetical protein